MYMHKALALGISIAGFTHNQEKRGRISVCQSPRDSVNNCNSAYVQPSTCAGRVDAEVFLLT